VPKSGDYTAPARSSAEKALSPLTKSQPACDQNSERPMKPLTRLQQEAEGLEGIEEMPHGSGVFFLEEFGIRGAATFTVFLSDE